ncbi:unnamed protein product [Boreogadus saida]
MSSNLTSSPQVSNRYVAAGSEIVTIELPAGTIVSDTDKLVWKRNGSLVHNKVKGNRNKFNVSPTWALEVLAAELQVVGQVDVYTLEVHDSSGKEKVTMKTFLHLLEKVRIPTLTINCTDKDNAVFHCFCNISQRQDLVYKWTLSGNVQLEKTQTFKVPRKLFGRSVSCEVSNKAGKESSAASEAKCKDSSASAVLYQIYDEYFWYIVGGGGGLVLLLFFITVLCCVRARTRRKNRMQMENEMRLEWTNQTPRQDQQQQREKKKKKKKKGPQPGGSQPHRCKSSQDANRSRRKDPAATPLASKDHATSAASSANPARPRPSPRPPQSERDGGLGVDHGPPLPKPRKKAGPKTNNRPRP